MNAQSLLQSQGWRGHGHTLHATDDSTGLARPLLVSRKDNRLGVGKKEHSTSDQWWLNAFDQQLKGLDTSKQGTVVQTVTQGSLNVFSAGRAGKYAGAGGLYASFVRGGMLEGTISTHEDSTGASTPNTTATTTSTSTTTPEAEDRPQRQETREERRARKESRRLRKAEKATRKAAEARTKADKAADATAETKEERRARKGAKRRRKEERRQRRNKADDG